MRAIFRKGYATAQLSIPRASSCGSLLNFLDKVKVKLRTAAFRDLMSSPIERKREGDAEMITQIIRHLFGASLIAAFAVMAPGQLRAANLTTLIGFNGADGTYPIASLITDAKGNLISTTLGDTPTTYQFGTVFEIAKTSGGYASTPTTLVSFCSLANCTNGAYPEAGVIADANSNLFGTAVNGGANNFGAVFEVINNGTSAAPSYATTPTTLVSFNGTNGAYPYASLIADTNGNLFGTTLNGGASNAGTVFEIINNGTSAAPSYAITPTTLVSFNGTDGGSPSGLIADTNGNLFGTTQTGGVTGYSNGTVFEIINNGTSAAPSYATTPTTLVSFDGTDGATPVAGLIIDANGNLFGTTYFGGANNLGTVFEIAKTSGGYASTPTTLVTFNGANGSLPYAGSLLADADGNLFGTTQEGGASNFGTVFEITGSGFVPPVVFVGTAGTPNCIGTSVSTLAQTYGGLAHAAAGLNYSSVADLQSAIATYCGD